MPHFLAPVAATLFVAAAVAVAMAVAAAATVAVARQDEYKGYLQRNVLPWSLVNNPFR